MIARRRELCELIGAELATPVDPAIAELAERVRAGRHGVAAMLFYGSGLWKPPAADTVFDFYLLVDSYRAFDPRRIHALFGRLLPPNVYYLEHGKLRCKAAVIRVDQFARAAAGHGPNSQIWARFAQPCRLVYARDPATRDAVAGFLADAVITFHAQTLPLLGTAERSARDVWLRGLRQTYGNEWRSESGDRAETLYTASREALDARSRLVLTDCRPAPRVATRGARRALAKIVYFLQLLKAVFTFEGGVDYALWKIERQSGVKLEASDFQRRHPLLAAWPLVWKAWRAGGLR
ncbi:MAG TPA: hypothetical protein VK973_16465 [Arenicellales bacterium]|nr:hypothetical protein [Arenicellales bacterium]